MRLRLRAIVLSFKVMEAAADLLLTCQSEPSLLIMTQFWLQKEKKKLVPPLPVCQFILAAQTQGAIYTLLLFLPAGRPIFTPIAPSKNTTRDSWSRCWPSSLGLSSGHGC